MSGETTTNVENGNAIKSEDEIHWRDKAVRSRLGFALQNDKVYTDVVFIVGKEEDRISAHKLILRLSSLVFENLISSHEEQGLSEIRLPNSSSSIFRRLLKFIYTDELEMYEFIQFLRVARDFGFLRLAEQSIGILKKTEATPANAVFRLDISKGLGDSQLEESSLLFILNNAKEVLNSRTFLMLSYVSLCQLLVEDRLCSDELTIFKAVLRWTKFQCRRNNIAETPENFRKILKDARFYIRYTCIKYDQFLQEVKPSGVLDGAEYVQVLKCFVDLSSNPLKIKTNPRNSQDLSQNLLIPNKRKSKSPESLAKTFAPLPVPPPDLSSLRRPFADDVYECTQPVTQENMLIPAPIQMKHCTPAIRREDTDDSEFQLKHCTIDFQDLVNTVQRQLYITKIILYEVAFQNSEFGNGIRAFLPNLQVFHFIQQKDGYTKLPDKSFMNCLTTKDFLFFEKTQGEPWAFENLWSLGVEICIDIKGLRLMEINHREQKLVLAYPNQLEADLILKSLLKQTHIKQICLTSCTITGVVNQLSTRSWEKLVLQGVSFHSSKVQLMNKCTVLKYLSIFSTDGTPINLLTDLTKQRGSLLRLALAKANIGGWVRKVHIEPFSVLEELYLDVCFWDHGFIDRIHHIFPKLKRIAIRSKDSCRVCSRLMSNILEIHSLEQIAIFRYPGGEDTHENPNIDLFSPKNLSTKSAVLRFLQKCGIEFPDNYVMDFILVKKSTTPPSWKAMWDTNELDEIHFQCSMLNEFFTDSSSSKMIE